MNYILCLSDIHFCEVNILKENLNKIKNTYKNSLKCILLLGDNNESIFPILKEIFTTESYKDNYMDLRILGVLGNHDYPYIYEK